MEEDLSKFAPYFNSYQGFHRFDSNVIPLQPSHKFHIGTFPLLRYLSNCDSDLKGNLGTVLFLCFVAIIRFYALSFVFIAANRLQKTRTAIEAMNRRDFNVSIWRYREDQTGNIISPVLSFHANCVSSPYDDGRFYSKMDMIKSLSCWYLPKFPTYAIDPLNQLAASIDLTGHITWME